MSIAMANWARRAYAAVSRSLRDLRNQMLRKKKKLGPQVVGLKLAATALFFAVSSKGTAGSLEANRLS